MTKNNKAPNPDASIKLCDPGKENRAIKNELEGIFEDLLNSGHYILGEHVSSFEKNFSKYCQSEFCISTGNGTDALIIALKATGCDADDKIATVPNAGFYSSTAIKTIGAEPVYVDIDVNTMAMSSTHLETILKTNPDIKAIIVTHLYGAMVDIDKIVDLAKEHNVLLIEDCAQAHGAVYKGKYAGTFGVAGTYSFYPTKNLGALGDGGAIITSSREIHDNAMQLRQYGWAEKYNVALPGGQNSRLDELQAAILNFKLKKLDERNLIRKAIVKRYASKQFNHLTILNIDDTNFVAHLAVVRTKYRNQLKSYLIESGIGSDVHFPILDYKQLTNYRSDIHCDNAERLVDEILSVPCHPEMTEEEISYVIEKLLEFDTSL